MSTLEKVATYLRAITKTTSLTEAQREAELALNLIESKSKSRKPK